MATPCPVPSWRDLPNLKRSTSPGVVLFAEACLPGTETAAGCPAGSAFYSIAVPWSTITSDHTTATERAWTAPGGNRYFTQQLAADPRDPRVASVLRKMAAYSKTAFADTFGSNKNTMAAIMANAPGWAASYGLVSVETAPSPTETAAAFVARGGYLLDVRPGWSAFLGKTPLWAVGREPWMSTSIRQYELWATYDPAGTVTLMIRVVFEGDWTQATNATIGKIDSVIGNPDSVCGKLTDPTVAVTIGLTSKVYPAAAAPYKALATTCKIMALFPEPDCVPPIVAAGAAGATIVAPTGGVTLGPGATQAGRRPQSAQSAGNASVYTALAPAVTAGPPLGSIAMLDATASAGYRMAIPQPGAGVTHREVGVPPTARWSAAQPVPPGVLVVNRGAWDKATLPWIQRRSSKIGLVVGGGVAAVAAVAAAVVHGHAS